MQAHILSLHTPWIPGVGFKDQNIIFKVVVLQINLKSMEHRAPCKHIVCTFTHTRSLGMGERSKGFIF